MQKHQVEIGAVAELHAAELAVAHRADAHGRAARSARRTSARRTARVICCQARLQRALDDELGDVGEPIADLHDRQAPGQIGDRDTEYRRALEVPQRLDLVLRIIVAQLLHAREVQVAREIGALGKLGQQALIDQLIEQQRIGGDLLHQKVAVRPHSSTRRAARRARSRAAARSTPSAGRSPRGFAAMRLSVGSGAGARADRGEQRRQQRLQALGAGLVQPPHAARIRAAARAAAPPRRGRKPSAAEALESARASSACVCQKRRKSSDAASRAAASLVAEDDQPEMPAHAARDARRARVASSGQSPQPIARRAARAPAHRRAGGELLIGAHLQAILEPPQEHVRRIQLNHDCVPAAACRRRAAAAPAAAKASAGAGPGRRE